MTVEDNRVGWRFWLWWVLASTVGWFLGFLVGFIGGHAVEEILPSYGNAAIGAGLGAGVGIMQWLILRRQVSRAGWWVLASIVGLAVAPVVGTAVALAGGYSITPESFGVLVGWIVVAAVGGAMAGIMQWLILRRQVSRAGWCGIGKHRGLGCERGRVGRGGCPGQGHGLFPIRSGVGRGRGWAGGDYRDHADLAVATACSRSVGGTATATLGRALLFAFLQGPACEFHEDVLQGRLPIPSGH